MGQHPEHVSSVATVGHPANASATARRTAATSRRWTPPAASMTHARRLAAQPCRGRARGRRQGVDGIPDPPHYRRSTTHDTHVLPGSLAHLVHRCTIAKRMRSVTADKSCWPRSAKCSYVGDTTWVIYRLSTCTRRVRGLSAETAMRPYRSCAPPSTISSARDNCWDGAFRRRVFWWRHCLIVEPTMMWPKPRPPSSG